MLFSLMLCPYTRILTSFIFWVGIIVCTIVVVIIGTGIACSVQTTIFANVIDDSCLHCSSIRYNYSIKEKTMKLRDRYPKLKDEAFVRSMVVKSVHGSMMLENQGVSKDRLEKLYAEVKEERRLIKA
ncbi:hypothetical protein C8E01_11789 [Pontibacter virosus]|uniref:Uncharacterized protein n=2 Tax=Hymenobacteraceae TaxID=1853232 RepID=A0A2U1APN4_9BACT|nr:hypothetical protein C8E01_11789 [Pontibacter virosus]